jgi:hypothetical protein
MSEQTVEDVVKALMTQVQVVASAWSLVGGVFDNGGAKDNFDYEREELEDQLNEHLGGVHERLQGMVDGIRFLQKWHEQKISSLQGVRDAAQEGTALELGSDARVVLTADMAKGLRIGVTVAESLFGKLPIALSKEG